MDYYLLGKLPALEPNKDDKQTGVKPAANALGASAVQVQPEEELHD